MEPSDKNPEQDSMRMKDSLERVFEEYAEDIPVPENLEKRVFDSLDAIFLAAEVVDLFSGKFLYSEANFIDEILHPKDKDTDNNT